MDSSHSEELARLFNQIKVEAEKLMEIDNKQGFILATLLTNFRRQPDKAHPEIAAWLELEMEELKLLRHGPVLSVEKQKAQGQICSCKGTDEYCPCQNVVQNG